MEKRKIGEWVLLGIVALLSVAVNLPGHWVPAWLEQKYLLYALVLVLAAMLVRYRGLALVLVIGALTVGANLPRVWAEDIGVHQDVMLVALVAVIILSFLNYVIKLPKGARPLVRLQNENGARALCNAAYKGRASMVYTLISAGIDVNVRDSHGNTPLILAGSQGHRDVVKMLLDNGADANAKDGRGRTALRWALDRRYSRTAILLQHAGATE